ncbi:GNAT family N-acetyltransferase [Maioricimonas rarisocia]|uniref:GNAT family N-acetyltransferase n=1 Tax=Maioricimonas rarisocia TaxID=2528026 RepID=UPI0018D23537|nr:GNAT family N-acetyltransferase [Maioricimonas rarisocia]
MKPTNDSPAPVPSEATPIVTTAPSATAAARGEDGTLTIHCQRLQDANHHLLCGWRRLAQQCLEPNAFLAPDFVLPATRHLQPASQPLLVWGETPTGRIVGLGVFEAVAGSPRLPLPHLRSWQTIHTFLDGFLVAEDGAETFFEGFWEFVSQSEWHGVELLRCPANGRMASALFNSAERLGVATHSGRTWERAMLRPREGGPETLTASTSVRRARSLRRSWRLLQRHGTPHVEFCRDPATIAQSAATLLFLEDLGWKHRAGTSLAADPRQKEFFEDLVSRFAESNQIVFSELRIDDRTIASVVNLVSGGAAFAFKLGWDPQFERACPGYQLKAQTVVEGPAHLADLDFIDSCASPGSFIEHVWPERRTLCAPLFLASRRSRAARHLVDAARTLRDLWRGADRDGTT